MVHLITLEEVKCTRRRHQLGIPTVEERGSTIDLHAQRPGSCGFTGVS